MICNTPTLNTPRLILRKFTEHDVTALFRIHSDEEVNTFLPLFPLKSMAEAELYLKAQYLSFYQDGAAGYRYAICLKSENTPIGYVHVSRSENHDLGYGLCKEFWHQGIVSEAAKAVIARLKIDGIPFITATHDVKNPHSGGVMQNCGMHYCYTYEELVQPKNYLVTFRMYQLNLDGCETRIDQTYWTQHENHFIEENREP